MTSTFLASDLVGVAIRLHNRFSAVATFAEVVAVIDECCRDLDIATSGGLPELVERLAAQRLLDSHQM
jgi:hypothetical protein